MMRNKIILFVKQNKWLKRLNTQLNKPTNQNSLKVIIKLYLKQPIVFAPPPLCGNVNFSMQNRKFSSNQMLCLERNQSWAPTSECIQVRSHSLANCVNNHSELPHKDGFICLDIQRLVLLYKEVRIFLSEA